MADKPAIHPGVRPTDPAQYLRTRKTLVKALHTATTIPRLAVYLIQSDKFRVTQPEAAVREALKIVGQSGDWSNDDPQLVKCIEATKKLLAK